MDVKFVVDAAVMASLAILLAFTVACAFMCYRERVSRWVSRRVREFMGMRIMSKVIVLVFVPLFTYIGGSKSIMNITSHDDGIDLVAAEASSGASVTNQIPQSIIEDFGHGTNITAYSFSVINMQMTPEQLSEKVWYRDSNKEQWTQMSDSSALPDGISVSHYTEVNSPTTTVHFIIGPTNSFKKAMIHVGDELPPVYIEIEGGVTFDSLTTTSKKMTVTYSVDQSVLTGRGVVLIEYQELNSYGNWSGEWTTLRQIEASAGTHTEELVGFFVRKRRRYRIRLQVEVSE